MYRIIFLILFFTAFLLRCGTETYKKPNVLFIAIDDMNDWTTLFSEDNPIKTPNLKKLASIGVFFDHGYCNAPSCNPSRFSVLTGLLPSSTGVYENTSHWKTGYSNVTTIPGYFQANGYKTYASGKIFHHAYDVYYKYEDFDEYLPFKTAIPDDPMPETNLNGIKIWHHNNGDTSKVSPNFDWGIWPPDESDHVDNKTVEWALNKLHEAKSGDEPFFMAVGIFRPHMPFYVPKAFMDKYPLETLAMPNVKPDDLKDLPEEALDFVKRPWYKWMSTFAFESQKDSLVYKKAVQAYQAASTFCDYQVGRLLKALENEGLKENTIIVLWSDHGYHLGEKDHWEKFILYEKTTHIPYIIAAPGYEKGKISPATVGLIDLFPTLVDLCNLPEKEGLDGKSLVGLLKDPSKKWERPVITTFEQGNHAVRGNDFRYIRYRQGAEELYHTTKDPNEWNNLAGNDEYQEKIKELKGYLPKKDAEPVPNFVKQKTQIFEK